MDTGETVDSCQVWIRFKGRKETDGTKLVWNSFKSTLSDPSNLRDAVMEDTT